MTLPCPFCGATLAPTFDASRVHVVGYGHPRDPTCIMSGSHIGAKIIDRWERRHAPPVAYEVIDGRPVFNDKGRGVEASASMLNKFIDWYESRR